MSQAILVSSPAHVAVAVAALTSGALDPASTTLVVVNPAQAAEVQTEFVDAARTLAGRHRLSIVDLNEVLAPFHPLGWRAADLTSEEVRAAWSAAGGLTELTAFYCFTGDEAAQRGFRRVFGAARRPVAQTARSAGAALRRRTEPLLIAGGGPGVAVLRRLLRTKAVQVSVREIVRAGAELDALGVAVPPPVEAIALWRPALWLGLARGATPPATAAAVGEEQQPTPDRTESAVEFVRSSIERIDARRASGSGDSIA